MSSVRCLGEGIADTCLALECANLVIADVEVEVDGVKLTHKIGIFQKTAASKNTYLERLGTADAGEAVKTRRNPRNAMRKRIFISSSIKMIGKRFGFRHLRNFLRNCQQGRGQHEESVSPVFIAADS
ncbi:MAG: hypothetical protein P8Z70_06505 [Desulfuromonadales bacterium]|jgi:hypothetical protein